MGNIYQSYFNMYRYFIRGKFGVIEISQPIGWDSDNKVFKRSKDVHGVFINLSSTLEFYVGDEDNDGGYDYLKKVYDVYGINAIVSLIKEENISGTWEEVYRGYFDFSTYVREENKIKIMFNESGLYEKIKARNSEELELDRLTTMDGSVLPQLRTDVMEIEGRKILIITDFVKTIDSTETTFDVGANNNIQLTNYKTNYSLVRFVFFYPFVAMRYHAVAIPLTMVAEQDGNSQTIYDNSVDVNGWSYDKGTTGAMFYADSLNDNVLKIDFDLEFVVNDNYIPGAFKVRVVKYKNGVNYDFDSVIELLSVDNPVKNISYTYKVSSLPIPIGTGESLSLVLHAISHEDGGGGHTYIKIINPKVNIIDETYYPASQSKFVLPFEALERITNVITDKVGVLKSKALGRTDLGYINDGYASLTGLTNGFWVRGFNEDKITTSFKDFIDSFNAVWQIGYGIEKIGFTEILRVEHIKHFYQYFIALKLGGRPSNITRSCAKDYYYSSVEVGYSKPSGTVLYEEVLGLDEYNIKNNYTTAITRIENKNKIISPYRADSYGTEFARRKPKAKFPEEDTRYDLDVMMNDLKRGLSNVFLQRKWIDDFEVPTPFNKFETGIYSPETATNLRFSPMNVLKRWGFWIKGGLMKNLTEYIRYSSSNGNSSLKTKSLIAGSVETAENGNILNSDLDKNLFNGDLIKFKFPVESQMLKTLNGTTLINGELVMNYYGLIEFENEYGELETGFLMSLEPNGDGDWELLSSTKRVNKYNSNANTQTIITPPTNLNVNKV